MKGSVRNEFKECTNQSFYNVSTSPTSTHPPKQPTCVFVTGGVNSGNLTFEMRCAVNLQL